MLDERRRRFSDRRCLRRPSSLVLPDRDRVLREELAGGYEDDEEAEVEADWLTRYDRW